MDTNDLQARLDAQRAAFRLPSASLAMTGPDGSITTLTSGDVNLFEPEPSPPNPRTRYRIASITKPQVAVAVLAKVDEGVIDLADAMGTHVPDAPAPEATIAQYLSHTAGLVAEPPGPWWERAGSLDWEPLMASIDPDQVRIGPPGLVHHYSNLGYGVLGHLVEKLYDQPWYEALEQVLWGRLGMQDTAAFIDAETPQAVGTARHPIQPLVHREPVAQYRAMGPAGELWSTPSDLVRFGTFLAGRSPEAEVLRPETLALMRQPATLDAVPGQPWTGGYGLGLMVQNLAGRTTVLHTGSVPGFTAQLSLDPVSGAVAALCANSTTWCGGVADWLGLAEPRPLPAAQVTPLPDRVRTMTGLWYRGVMTYHLTVRGERIELARVDQPGLVNVIEARPDGALVGTSHTIALGERMVLPDQDEPEWFTMAGLHFSRQPYDRSMQVPGPDGDDRNGWERPAR